MVVPVAERIESVFVRNTIVGVGCHEPLGATVPTGIVRPAATTETTTVPRLELVNARSVGEPRSTQIDGVVADAPLGSESAEPPVRKLFPPAVTDAPPVSVQPGAPLSKVPPGAGK